MNAQSVISVSRTKKSGFVTYDEALNIHNDAEIIINTTPVGMYPEAREVPVNLDCFSKLQAVVDVIYNPLNTRLILSAKEKGIKVAQGLYMLVAQAYRAAELFCGEKIPTEKLESVYGDILKQKQNIVLIGMPSAGKTTIGEMLSKTLGMPFFDSDIIIKEKTGKMPVDIIKTDGEAVFREIESKVIYELSLKNRSVIATGGGAVIKQDNILSLKSNGIIYYIDRPVDLLVATPDRPLSSSKLALIKLYNERKNLYINAADKTIVNDKELCLAAEEIRKDFLL